MLEAYVEDEKRRAEDEYFKTAWLASHIMNASGNYKQQITPEKLLGKATAVGVQQITEEERDEALEELKAKFGK